MLERLYEDATSFGFPEERFERVYKEVETTLFRDAVRDRVVAPLDGAWIEAERIDFGGGLSMVRGDHADAPPEAVYPEGGDGAPAVVCALERDMAADQRLGAGDADAAHAPARDGAALVAARLGEPRRPRLAAHGPRPLVGGSRGRHGRRPRRRLAAARRRGEGAARIRGRDRGSPSRWNARAGRSRASRWRASARATRRRCRICCSRCAGCSTRRARRATRASRCAWRRCAPRRAGGARSRGTSRPPSRSSAC